LVLMTPQVHSLHHSIDRTLSDSNYVNVFPLSSCHPRGRPAAHETR